jgi:NADH-quinone oxidoreductase subunit J
VFDRLPLPSQFDRTIMAGGTVMVLGATPVVSAPEFVFFLASAVLLASALGVVLMKNIVHAALSLVVTLLGVAAIYLLLLTEFLALVQVLVYGGGVVILLLFGLMMTNAQDDPVVTDGSQKPFAFGVAALIAGVFIAMALDAQWGNPEASIVPFRDFGARLFRDFSVPVIIVAVLLDIAFTGAFINARRGDDASAARGEARS